jgi:hypothetical protein
MPTKQAATNLPAARMAVAYVRSKMDIGASNKVGPGMGGRLLCAGGTFSKGEMGSRVDEELARIKKADRQRNSSAVAALGGSGRPMPRTRSPNLGSVCTGSHRGSTASHESQ